MRWLKKSLIVGLVFGVTAAAGFGIWARGNRVVPIMMYHHVAPAETSRADTVSLRRFEWHMDYLKTHRFHVIRLDTLVEAIRQGKKLPSKSVVITFDDGYEDNYTQAFSVLKKHGFPATLFVSSDLINTPGYLTTAQIQQMRAHGVDIASHARTHVYLPDLPREKQREEIRESRRLLEKELGITVKYLAYPSGGFSEEIKQFVQEAGYQGACTTNRGRDRFNRDVYELNRVRFSNKDDRLDYLWMKLTGFYNLFRSSKNPY